MSHSRTSARGITGPTRSLLVALLVALVSLFAVGCGSSSEDYVVNGNDNTPPPAPEVTGSVTLQLAKVQATNLPQAAENLSIEFFDANSYSVLGPLTRPFAPTITIEGVPTSATLVRVTTFDVHNNQIARFSAIFNVVPGGNVQATMGEATLAAYLLRPNPSKIKMLVNSSQTISLDVAFAFGPENLPYASASSIGGGSTSFSSDSPGIASVDALTGKVTAGSNFGSTTIRVTFALNGRSVTVAVPVRVTTGLVVTPETVSLTNTTQSVVLSTKIDGVEVKATGELDINSFSGGVTKDNLTYSVLDKKVTIAVSAIVDGSAFLDLQFEESDGTAFESVIVNVYRITTPSP